jgi:hypothetical protein
VSHPADYSRLKPRHVHITCNANGAASLAGRPAVGGFRAAWHSNNFLQKIPTKQKPSPKLAIRSAGILPALQNYIYGISRFTFRASAGCTCVIFFRRRIRFGPFVPNMCRLPECPRKIFPCFVILKRFAAPRCVFNFSFLATVSFSQFRFYEFFWRALNSKILRRRRCSRRSCRALFRRQQSHQNICFHARTKFHLRILADFLQ